MDDDTLFWNIAEPIWPDESTHTEDAVAARYAAAIVRALDRGWRRSKLDPLSDRFGEQSLYPFWRSYIDAHPTDFFRD